MPQLLNNQSISVERESTPVDLCEMLYLMIIGLRARPV